MFNRRSAKSSKDTVHSLFQCYNENNAQQETTLGQSVVDFDQIEKHAERNSFRTYQDRLDEIEKLEQMLLNETINEQQPLSEEMEKIKQAEIRELKIREKICRDSPELIELRRKLQEAYANKEISLQLAEKEADKLEQKLLDEYYSKQMLDSNQMYALEEENKENMLARRKVEYRKALEQQMQDEIDAKREEKFKQYQEEQKMTQNEIERILQQDEKVREEKMNKKLQLKQEMEESMRSRQEMKHCEALKRKEDEKKLESYWEENYKHENNAKEEIENKKRGITERQEECARTLEEINKRMQTRTELVDNITVMTQLLDIENEKRHDLEDVNKKLRQEQICSELDDQCAEKVRSKLEQRKVNDNFHEQWIWGDSNQSKNQAEKKRQDMRDIAEYNRVTMVEHQNEKRLQRAAEIDNEQEQEAERAKQRLIEEERERLLKAQDPSVFQYLPGGVLKPEDLAHVPVEALNFNN